MGFKAFLRMFQIIFKIASILIVLGIVLVVIIIHIAVDGAENQYYYETEGVYFTEYEDMVFIGHCRHYYDDVVYIPETIKDKPVTAIDDGAFRGCDHTEIFIPDSVTYIGKDVFADCNEELKVYYDGQEVDPDELAEQLNEKPQPKKKFPWVWVALGCVVTVLAVIWVILRRKQRILRTSV